MYRAARTFACVALMLLIVLPVCAQDPDLQALISAANATDVETAARYFPPEIQEGIAKLPKEVREELNQNLSVMDMAKKFNVTLQFSTDSGPFILYDDPKGGFISHLEFYLDSRTYGNDQSELVFHIKENPDSESVGVAILRLKFVYPDWRVYEGETPKDHEIQRFDDEKLVQQFVDSILDGNESTARRQLVNYANSVNQYAAMFPHAGLPHSLTQLGPPDELCDPDERRAGLMNADLTTPPFEHMRYRFTYKRKDAERFTIVARPVKYKITGRESYYIDESMKIRFTKKDQAPDEHSKPLQ